MNPRLLREVQRPEDLEWLADGGLYEFVDGMPVEKNMGAESDGIGMTLTGFLAPFCRANQAGRVFGPQSGYRCFPKDRQQLRKPDVSFVARGRFPNDVPPKGDIFIAPDLAVEVVSPNDLYEDVAVRVADYRSAGVKLIWVISPATKTVLVRRLDGTCAELDETGELSGEGVLPGFTCKVADLFV